MAGRLPSSLPQPASRRVVEDDGQSLQTPIGTAESSSRNTMSGPSSGVSGGSTLTYGSAASSVSYPSQTTPESTSLQDGSAGTTSCITSSVDKQHRNRRQSAPVHVAPLEQEMVPPVATTVSDDDGDEGSFDPQDIERDAATERIACLVHVFFAFFAFLTGAAILLCVSIVSQYGIVVFGALSLFIIMLGGIFCLLDKKLKEDANWRPVRRRIHHWKAVATKVVLDEVRHFQLDWNEHMLLTDGEATADYDLFEGDNVNDRNVAGGSVGPDTTGMPRRKSVAFRIIKPFLKPFRGRRKRKKEQEAAAEIARSDDYVSPVV